MSSQPRGNVIIDTEECKGCGLCVESCPPECLALAPELNHYGVHAAQYSGEDCTGMRRLFLLLSGARRYHRRTPDAVGQNGCSTRAEAGGEPCGSSVKETLPS